MSSATDRFRQLLKTAGYSVTRARVVVFESLLGHEPLSMPQLVTKASTIDRASIYRAVELFERLGIVQRISTGWKYKLELTDTFAAHHHHLTCTSCERTVAMNEDELERLIVALSRRYGFVPTAHQIEIQGTCQQCQTALPVSSP
jgi:Fur family ferric uptake transcriptional regulator